MPGVANGTIELMPFGDRFLGERMSRARDPSGDLGNLAMVTEGRTAQQTFGASGIAPEA